MKKKSAYSKMYLVTPGVYEKLLKCLDEGDKRVTEDLNKNPEKDLQRPSESELQAISSSDIMSPEIDDEIIGSIQEPPEQQFQQEPQLQESRLQEPRVQEPQEPISQIPETREVQIYGPQDQNLPASAFESPTVTSPCKTLCSINKTKPQPQQAIDPEDIPLAIRFPRSKRGGIFNQSKRPSTLAKKGVYIDKRFPRLGESGWDFGWNCPVCGRKFSKKSNLTRHQLTVHKVLKADVRKTTEINPRLIDPISVTQVQPQPSSSTFGLLEDEPEAEEIVQRPASDFRNWAKLRASNPPMEGVEKTGRKRTIRRTKFKDLHPHGKARKVAETTDTEEAEESEAEFENWEK